MDDQYAINVQELAKRIGISRKIAYDLVNSRGFYPAFRIGRKILVTVEDHPRALLGGGVSGVDDCKELGEAADARCLG